MKKVISIVLALLMVAVMLPVMAAAADTEITTEAELRAAVSAMKDGDNVTVRLQNDVTVVGKLEVKAGTLTILGQGHTITFSNPNSTMHITGTGIVNLGTKEGEGNDLTLTSDNITDSVVYMAGSAVLNMYHGVTIKDSRAGLPAGGVQLEENSVFNMYGGVIDNCESLSTVAGGVCIDGGALFNMYDGVIQNCSGWQGGAVGVPPVDPIGGYISGPSGFHMYGGTIKDCHDKWYGGGAVCVYTAEPVSFIMDGGTITGCSADGKGYGGAIFIFTTHEDAVIEINKGKITGNSGVYGGGVSVYGGTVNIADGVALHNNTATKEGDDLYNKSGRITLGKLPAGLKLASSGRDIDGWYHDKTGARWSSKKCGGEEDRMEKHTETAFTDGRALKAAHGEAPAPAPPIIIVPEAPEQEAPNPTTGSRDLAGVAVAMAAVSLLGAAAVIRKK
jgi:hypothetical protein